jgi:hypothetical protein
MIFRQLLFVALLLPLMAVFMRNFATVFYD